jgi:hypothetical protein
MHSLAYRGTAGIDVPRYVKPGVSNYPSDDVDIGSSGSRFSTAFRSTAYWLADAA